MADSTQSSAPLHPAMASFLAGTVGGIAGVIVGHPFDTIKVRLQSQDARNPIYRGTWHCTRTIFKQERFRGFFKGMGSPLVGVAVVNALLFGVYGAILQAQLDHPSDKPTLWQIFIAGSGSGIVNSLISAPMELVKIRLQNQGAAGLSTVGLDSSAKFTGPIDATRYIYRQAGIRGIYRGFISTVWRETPSYGAYFVAYEVLCRTLAPEGTDPKDLSGVRLMLAGGLGGIVGWTSTYPIDVVKTMIQADEKAFNKKPVLKPPGVWTLLFRIYREQGIRSWFHGITATVLRAFPTNVAILSTWHMTMLYFRQLGWIDQGDTNRS